jgi:hypothetical protein
MRKSTALLFCLFAFAASVRAADFVVVNTNATGPGSLNQAIFDANAAPGADRIIFHIPGAGLHTIDASQTPLPDLTDTVTIDGYTQPGSKPNTAAIGSNAVLQIQVDGKRAGAFGQEYPGFMVKAAECMVRGLMITGFGNYNTGADGYGIEVLASGCTIEGNFIGTDGTNAAAFANNPYGIYVQTSEATIGGTAPAAHNVIGGNEYGIFAWNNGAGPATIKIIGNQIGTNPQESGATDGKVEGATNWVSGIMGFSSPKGGVVIGGTTPEEANLISGNSEGIEAYYNFLIEGNLIGLQPDRVTAVVNQRWGILVEESDNTVGGLAPGAGNQIAFNQTGINVVRLTNSGGSTVSAFRNSFLSNQIYANSKIGIDLDNNGVTRNDFGDGDAGLNNLQNFPVIASVGPSNQVGPANENTTVKGSLNSRPNSDFTLQFFRYHPVPELIKTLTVHTNAQGDAPFTFDFYLPPDEPGTAGSYYSGTATDANGNTSELSPPNGPVQLANISTRANVESSSYILIGGFIIKSDSPKKVIIRALGPSLNVPNALADPYLELYDSSGTILAKNDDWRSGQQQEVIDSGVAPSRDLESVIITTLPAGTYTAQVRGVNGLTGIGMVEIYDLDPLGDQSGRLSNLSSRAFVEPGAAALIGGLIVRGGAADRVLVRAIGPDLNVSAPMRDPTLELYDSSGAIVATNDNWRDRQEAEITATGLAPKDNHDAAIIASLAPGTYTAVLRGKNDTAGVALVEFYDLKN